MLINILWTLGLVVLGVGATADGEGGTEYNKGITEYEFQELSLRNHTHSSGFGAARIACFFFVSLWLIRVLVGSGAGACCVHIFNSILLGAVLSALKKNDSEVPELHRGS